ncbi:MAG TPA: tetraacyldisaccharide 4'-kinase [Longimicrobium sp.]|nr:tetraacyldisaccharide 4'-kinase [Longimicrobium sp.]
MSARIGTIPVPTLGRWGLSMKRPDAFVRQVWSGGGGAAGAVLRTLLAPAEAAYGAAVRARNRGYQHGWLRSERVDVPVISIGNVAVGGAGKTPFAAWTAQRLREWGRRPAIALRGYGEDEILLHRELSPDVPVFANRRRAEAARQAAAAGCDVVVLDDGFQHRALARDLDVVLLSVEGWTPRPRLVPRGPWREGLDALARADLIVLTRKSAYADRMAEVAAELAPLHPSRPIIHCALRASALVPLHPGGGGSMDDRRGVLAVAALAAPELFIQQLRMLGTVGSKVDVEAALYPDHHSFTSYDAANLMARAAGRTIVMTHKDAVKLRGLLPPSVGALVLEQSVVIERGLKTLEAALRRALEGAAR